MAVVGERVAVGVVVRRRRAVPRARIALDVQAHAFEDTQDVVHVLAQIIRGQVMQGVAHVLDLSNRRAKRLVVDASRVAPRALFSCCVQGIGYECFLLSFITEYLTVFRRHATLHEWQPGESASAAKIDRSGAGGA